MSLAPLICSVCSGRYWPNQQWIHDKHGGVPATNTVVHKVVNTDKTVVNEESPVVVNKRTKDRHKNKPERLEYVRKKMKEYRDRKRASG